MQNIHYQYCNHCNTKIAVTEQNPHGKCPFRFCKGFGYDSKTPQDTKITDKYVGKSIFAVDLGDIVHCIDVVDSNKLVCMTTGYPTIHIISENQFKELLSTQYLYVKSQN